MSFCAFLDILWSRTGPRFSIGIIISRGVSERGKCGRAAFDDILSKVNRYIRGGALFPRRAAPHRRMLPLSVLMFASKYSDIAKLLIIRADKSIIIGWTMRRYANCRANVTLLIVYRVFHTRHHFPRRFLNSQQFRSNVFLMWFCI